MAKPPSAVTVTGPEAGAVQEHQTEPSLESGSSGSRVAPRLEPMIVTDEPATAIRCEKSSLKGRTFTRTGTAMPPAPRSSVAKAITLYEDGFRGLQKKLNGRFVMTWIG